MSAYRCNRCGITEPPHREGCPFHTPLTVASRIADARDVFRVRCLIESWKEQIPKGAEGVIVMAALSSFVEELCEHFHVPHERFIASLKEEAN